MTWLFVAVALSSAVIAVCKLVFGLVALRGVPPDKRPELVRAVGDAWDRWRLR